MSRKHTGKILIIEDDKDVRILIEIILRGEFELTACEDGPSGIEAAHQDKPDLILLDNYMAGMSGFEVCRTLKDNQETSHIPIIILSAGSLKQDIAQGYATGADDYIVKPFEPEELVKRIKKLL